MTRYIIPIGAQMRRVSQGGLSESVTSTKMVVFNESDVLQISYRDLEDYPGVPDKSAPMYYTFILPKEAAPWTHISCAAEYVTIPADVRPYAAAVNGSHRTGELKNISVEEINKILGFTPNVDDDPDKVAHSWGFVFEGENLCIWDYKGSQHYNQFSTFGPKDKFVALFGEQHVG